MFAPMRITAKKFATGSKTFTFRQMHPALRASNHFFG
jgi:hypothetical protein